MTIHVFFTYPETSRRTLEEVDYLFEANIKPWQSARTKDIFGERLEQRKIQQSAPEKEDITHTEQV